MRVTLIHNQGAGDAEQPGRDELLTLLSSAGHEVKYQSSKEGNWQTVLEEPADLVAVAGGDGTVGKVARQLIGRRTLLTILPLGTANNISNALGIAGPAGQLINGWSAARRVKFDVGVASGPWGDTVFVEGIGAGLYTRTMSRLNARDNLQLAHLNSAAEKLSDVLRMLRDELRDYPARRLEAELDGQDITGEYLLLEAMNIKYIGPGLRLAPDADPGDGQLDFVLVAESERQRLAAHFNERARGKKKPLRLTARRGQHLRLQWHGFEIHIDDDVWPGIGSPSPTAPLVIDVRVDKHALEFLVP